MCVNNCEKKTHTHPLSIYNKNLWVIKRDLMMRKNLPIGRASGRVISGLFLKANIVYTKCVSAAEKCVVFG